MANPDQWTVAAEGHKGDINVGLTRYQTILLQSHLVMTPPVVFGDRNYVTIENDGPGAMRVWIDTMPAIQLLGGLAGGPTDDSKPERDPAGNRIAPDLLLANGQSATVIVASIVMVRSAGRRGSKGSYVISWCCPHPVNINISETVQEYKEEMRKGAQR